MEGGRVRDGGCRGELAFRKGWTHHNGLEQVVMVIPKSILILTLVAVAS